MAALAESGLLDSPPEEAFDRLTHFAVRLLDVPAAVVSLVDEHRQFFKSAVGLPEPWATRRETPLSLSFCQHVVGDGEPLVIVDARADPRVAENKAIEEFGVIAYAGMPLPDPNGHVLGAFCVIDGKPREWSEDDLAVLHSLAALAAAELRLRAMNRRLNAENDRLETAVAARTADLKAAADDLRAAAEAVQTAASAERDRLARVLHDHLQQLLVGAKMTLAAGGPREDAIGFIEEAIAESRSLAAELSPPVLRSRGLAPALDWLAARTTQRHGLRVSTDCDSALSKALPPAAAAVLFEAARELLLNTLKHASARAVAVRLRTAEFDGAPAAELTFRDDGCGFPDGEGDLGAGDGSGLANLRLRVAQWGGTVATDNQAEGGAIVKLRLPLPRD
ncbi:Oxygen sensor histidine kinase NreB [Alienimonas californiensis]|uniref:Oxygen sensor histidine kinase NreB n=1 Tax=Alienimonas californiensis TaxID=2527989 RepID=A0A517PE87_9PLAN|nr:Oxygen sensor histidine kinase NreB [Alienimonas californiensis]